MHASLLSVIFISVITRNCHKRHDRHVVIVIVVFVVDDDDDDDDDYDDDRRSAACETRSDASKTKWRSVKSTLIYSYHLRLCCRSGLCVRAQKCL